jgi:hypothetical protein
MSRLVVNNPNIVIDAPSRPPARRRADRAPRSDAEAAMIRLLRRIRREIRPISVVPVPPAATNFPIAATRGPCASPPIPSIARSKPRKTPNLPRNSPACEMIANDTAVSSSEDPAAPPRMTHPDPDDKSGGKNEFAGAD